MDEKTRYVLIYDGQCDLCTAQKNWIVRLAGPDRIQPVSLHVSDLEERFPSVRRAGTCDAMHLVAPDGSVYRGAEAVREIVGLLPFVGWARTLFRLPGVMRLAHRGYRWVAANRYRWSRRLPEECETGACRLHPQPPHPAGRRLS